MQQVTVGPKYQIVIPKDLRKKIKRFKPGDKVYVSLQGENKLVVQTDPQSWVERTRGMMTEAWKDIDTIAELEKTRNEWEERLEELGRGIK